MSINQTYSSYTNKSIKDRLIKGKTYLVRNLKRYTRDIVHEITILNKTDNCIKIKEKLNKSVYWMEYTNLPYGFDIIEELRNS
jgi:hypothetical protein